MKIFAQSQFKGAISIFFPESGKIYYITIATFRVLEVAVIRSDNLKHRKYIFQCF